MANQAHRLDDLNEAGGALNDIPQGTVFTNDKLQSIDGSKGTAHPPCPNPGIHCAGAWVTDNGSSDTFVHDIAANFKGNPDTCTHKRDAGSPNVFINQGGNTIQGLPILDVSEVLVIPEVVAGTTELQAAIHLKDEPIEDDGLAVYPTGTPAQSVANGLIEGLPDPEEIDEDQEPPEPVADVPGDCATDIFSEPTNFNFPGSFQLSPNFTLAQLTTNTALSKYSLRPQGGLTTNQIVCNLRLLCINILEPLKASNRTMFITSGFRHGTGSQHTKGQAADVQFGGFSFQNYWDLAKTVKNSLPYDQYILELGNTYWFHLSYIPGGRHQVLTRTRPGTYKPGLIRLV